MLSSRSMSRLWEITGIQVCYHGSKFTARMRTMVFVLASLARTGPLLNLNIPATMVAGSSC